MNSTQLKRVFGLDFIRTVAISLVVLSHCTYLLFQESTHGVVIAIRGLGAVGVDLFFVLSGFLIGGIMLKQINLDRTSYSDLFVFWKRRWLRTLPNYFLVLLINVLLLIYLGNQLPDLVGIYIPFLQNFASPHPDFFREAWSLSVEEYAYLGLPLLLYLSFYIFKYKNKLRLFLWVTILVILVMSILKLLYYIQVDINLYPEWSASFRKVVVYRVDSIYFGFLIAYITVNKPVFTSNYKKKLLLLGLVLFAILHVMVYTLNLRPESHLAFYVFVYLQLITISLGLLLPYFSQLKHSGIYSRIIEFISVRSYAIYLVNYSIVLLSIQSYFDMAVMSMDKRIAIVLLFLIVTVLLSVIIYKFFEVPILKYRDRKFKR